MLFPTEKNTTHFYDVILSFFLSGLFVFGLLGGEKKFLCLIASSLKKGTWTTKKKSAVSPQLFQSWKTQKKSAVFPQLFLLLTLLSPLLSRCISSLTFLSVGDLVEIISCKSNWYPGGKQEKKKCFKERYEGLPKEYYMKGVEFWPNESNPTDGL